MRLILKLAIATVMATGAAVGFSLATDANDNSAKLAQNIEAHSSFILRGASVTDMVSAVERVGGEVTRHLDLIEAIAAKLTFTQLHGLAQIDRSIRAFEDAAVRSAGRKVTSTVGNASNKLVDDSYYPTQIGADILHMEGYRGQNVGVAVLDSGIWSTGRLTNDTANKLRLVGSFSVYKGNSDADESGHGTHLASIIASADLSSAMNYSGVAPDVDLINVRAFDANGNGTYADVIWALEWIIANKDALNIRVLNLSFSASPQSWYWEDPLNLAVMAAWDAGIVVVTSAGNKGESGPMSVGVPGNVPYVITVGAMTDNFTPLDPSDDRLAKFSSVGPTHEGFVKPEVVAPGGHMQGIMDADYHKIALDYPEFADPGKDIFSMSGTSQAAAVVSAAAALILQNEPYLTPDQVKCKLMSTARPAVDETGAAAYSIFEQGAGMINAYDAVHGGLYDCANNGLDIKADIAGEQHFGGLANRDADGNYYVMGLDGYLWDASSLTADGYLWGVTSLSSNGYLWGNATSFNIDGYLWTASYDSLLSTSGYLWGVTSVATWVEDIASLNTWIDEN